MIETPAIVSLISQHGKEPVLQILAGPPAERWILRLRISHLNAAGLLVALAEHAAKREEAR